MHQLLAQCEGNEMSSGVVEDHSCFVMKMDARLGNFGIFCGLEMATATNHLPHNRDRKAKDEAADMLTLPTQSGGETEAQTRCRAA
jgi:hypothetical protein